MKNAEPPRPSPKIAPKVRDDGVVRIFRERAGRSGKIVTLVHGLSGQGPTLIAVAGDLKRLCGAGGTVRDRVVKIQDDHRAKVAEHPRGRRDATKIAGYCP